MDTMSRPKTLKGRTLGVNFRLDNNWWYFSISKNLDRYIHHLCNMDEWHEVIHNECKKCHEKFTSDIFDIKCSYMGYPMLEMFSSFSGESFVSTIDDINYKYESLLGCDISYVCHNSEEFPGIHTTAIFVKNKPIIQCIGDICYVCKREVPGANVRNVLLLQSKLG